jgi:hypothetical protein
MNVHLSTNRPLVTLRVPESAPAPIRVAKTTVKSVSLAAAFSNVQQSVAPVDQAIAVLEGVIQRTVKASLACVLTFLCACAPNLSTAPVQPVYSGDPPRPEDVVRLFGPLAFVDGDDVSPFHEGVGLRPGCHRLTTRSDTVDAMAYGSAPAQVSRAGRGGAATFFVAMKPGHTYVVERRVLHDGSPRLRIALSVEDLDHTGAHLQTLYPSSDYDLERCKADAGA